jgi:hypothetical protein
MVYSQDLATDGTHCKAPRIIAARSKNETFIQSGKILFQALTLRSLTVLSTELLGNK